MANQETKQQQFSKKLNSLSHAVLSLNYQVQAIDNRIDGLNARVQKLPTRILQLRRQNYLFFLHLEKNQMSLSENWEMINPDLQAYVRERRSEISVQTREVQQRLGQERWVSNYNSNNLGGIEARISELHSNVSQLNEYVSDFTSDISSRFQDLENDLRVGEHTVNLISQASFLWKEGEAPVLAVKAKDLNNDINGIITLTNHRFIFEGEKEIILKKRFFIVTEKKIVRELVLEKPIGMIDRLTKGRVGLLKGSGIFVEFKPQSGLPEMKLDTKDHEANWLVKFYNFIISGQADEELSQIMGDMAPEKEAPQILTCKICGAPYSDEIYRGQTSVKCKYCGAVLSL